MENGYIAISDFIELNGNINHGDHNCCGISHFSSANRGTAGVLYSIEAIGYTAISHFRYSYQHKAGCSYLCRGKVMPG